MRTYIIPSVRWARVEQQAMAKGPSRQLELHTLATGCGPIASVIVWFSTTCRSCKMGLKMCDKKAAQVSKSARILFLFIGMIMLMTKFRTGSLDHMRRGSNAVLRKKNNQKMTLLYVYLYKPAKLPRSLKQLPPIRRALR